MEVLTADEDLVVGQFEFCPLIVTSEDDAKLKTDGEILRRYAPQNDNGVRDG